MSRNFMNTRLWSLTVVLIIGIAACMVPAAAENAWFEIKSDPPGALACLDHWNCQNTPFTVATDPDSYHSITVSKDGYQMATQTVYANGLGESTNVMVFLVKEPDLTGTLDADSNPAGADIWLDERYYGTTPQIIGGLSAGSHALTMRKAGYYDYLEPFMIVAGQISTRSPTMTAYSQSAGFGDLQIQSNPVGAAVYVNNNYKGTTFSSSALYVTQLPPGSYLVRVTLANYQSYSETVVVQAGKINEIYATLVPVMPGPTPNTNGQITVRSSPSGANIYLDNAYMGLTPLTLVNIPQGSHAIILKINGYRNWQSLVNVPAGSSTDVSGILASNPTPIPTAYPTQLAPLPTKSSLSILGIISAMGICGAATILYRKRE